MSTATKKRELRSSKKKNEAQQKDSNDAPPSVLPTENEIWSLLDDYFQKYGCLRHQLESFDAFIHTLLPHIVQESSEFRIKQGEDEEHIISLCNLSVSRPTTTDSDGVERDLMPHMARLRGLTYASAVLVDVCHDIYRAEKLVERRVFRETCLCRLPIMVGSRCCHTMHMETPLECRLDQGGYMIVSGCEKVLLAQEKLHHNTPYVFSVKQPSRFQLQCEIRACHERKLRSTSSLYIYITNAKHGTTPAMVVTLPFVNMHVPVLALFRLLGVETRQAVVEVIVGSTDAPEARLLASILDNDSTADMSAEALYEYIGKEGTRETTRERRQRFVEHIINCEVLPNMGLVQTPEVLRAKALYLGIMVRKLIRVYTGELQCDDRDHMAAKRVDCAGVQYSLLFRQVFRATYKSLGTQLRRAAEANKLHFTDVSTLVAGKKLTQAFRYALATGNWGILSTRGNTAQNGVAQQLTRMTSTATLSLLRKVSTPVARETKNPKPRQLHTTTWGLLCPMDTPEGASCGLVKSLAMLAHVRVGTFSDSVRELLAGMEDDTLHSLLEASAEVRCKGTPVLVNGCLTHFTRDNETAHQLATELRRLRRFGTLAFDTTVALLDGHLHIDTDAGCLLRPLFKVDRIHDLPRLLKEAPAHQHVFDHLIREGALEYIDKQEEECLRVALFATSPPKEGWGAYTHCEIDPSMITGVCGGLIPFPEFNQFPRNTFQSAMMKQSLGVHALNHPIRMDTIAHIMVSPQQPITTTRLDAILGASDAPAGINAMVVIKCFTGQNQEDSIIVNETALQRGMFRSVKLQTYRDEEHQNGGTDSERFEHVGLLPNVAGKRDSNYDHLEPDTGIIAVGTQVKANDVIIGKTVMTTELGEGARRAVQRDKSTTIKSDKGVVDAVLHSSHRDGTRIAKVRIRHTRQPIVGDKLSSRMGQKGVIGATLPQSEMPYTSDGMVPDLIINPHAIPSRMTVGMILEMLLNNLCAEKGFRGDGTMFRNTSIEHICEELEQMGCDRYGRRQLHNPLTGESYEGMVFFAPVLYQRLRHMASDKDHARSRGPVMMLSRQPTEGRARDGGLRFGEMERDCLISHGATEFLRDRLLDNSDPSLATLCGKCGLLAQPAAEGTHVRHKKAFCKRCGTGEFVHDMRCPFAFRLLLQELSAMNIAVRFDFEEEETEGKDDMDEDRP